VTFTTSLSESCFSDVTTVSSNVFFVIDDTYNYQRRLSKKQSEYPDDCSTWVSKKNVTTTKEYIYSSTDMNFPFNPF
jgi:hypothetical protein